MGMVACPISHVANCLATMKAYSAIRIAIEPSSEMIRLYQTGELSDEELLDLMGFVNTIITHITNGNKNEERLVNVMGGTVIETESERLRREGINQGKAQLLIEMGQKAFSYLAI